MKAAVLSVLTFAVVATPVLGIDVANDSPPDAEVVSPKPKHLTQINKLYVGPLKGARGSEEVRTRLIDALIKDKRFIIVNSPEQADAVLTEIGHGEGDLLRSSDARLIRSCSPKGAFVLVGKDKRVVWLEQVDSKRIFKPQINRSLVLIDRFVADLRKSWNMDYGSACTTWDPKYKGLGEP